MDIFLKSGAIPANRINHFVNVIHDVSNHLKVMPEAIVSHRMPIDSTKRKEIAIEYWQNFLAWFNVAYPQMQKTKTINAYRSFLAAHNINFAHGEGRRYGLSTTSERLGEYKDIMLVPEQIDKINRMLENQSDWESWSFMNINLHTGARAFAMASMSRDRPKYKRFLFFEDAKSDKANALRASYFMARIAIRFKEIFFELDRNSWLNEKTRFYALGDDMYFNGHPLHLFRHTMAQYYLAATNWSLAYVASLGGWENTEVLSKCYGGIPEHIKAQVARSLHVQFDTLNLSPSISTRLL